MKKNKFFNHSLVFLFSSLFCMSAWADHAWSTYHWERTSNHITIPIGDNVDSNWQVHFTGAIEDWNQSTVVQSEAVAGTADPKRCKADVGTVQVCNDTYGRKRWLGIAGISISDGHIISGYVKLNDTYFNTSFYNTPAWRRSVMCQEIGHIFGLAHQDEDFDNPNLFTCMDYTSNPDSNQYPNDHDYEQLETIYGHLDAADSGGDDGGGGGCNPNAPWCNGATVPAGWGKLVSKHGPKEVFELDLGNGNKIVTHVTWTLEHAENHGH